MVILETIDVIEKVVETEEILEPIIDCNEATALQESEKIHVLNLKENPEYMKDYKILREIDNLKNNRDIFPALYNKMRTDSNFKGQIGELYAAQNAENDFGGIIKGQVIHGDSKIDILITDTNKNCMINELVIEDGKIKSRECYLSKGNSIAMEVKNGSDKYLFSEINSGHLIKQVQDGKEVADQALVAIRQDVFEKIIENNSNQDVIKKLLDSDARIVSYLPSEDMQINILMEEIINGN